MVASRWDVLEIPSQDELEVKALTMEWQQAVLTATHEDKRRIDEVVGLFVYAGEVQAAGKQYHGQGSIKRYLTDLLLREDNVHVSFGELTVNKAQVDFPLRLTSDQRTLDLDLELHFEGPQVKSMLVHTRKELEAASQVSDLGASPNGPKWETDDGRVVQKIWQETDCFAIGNTFLLEKNGNHHRPLHHHYRSERLGSLW